MEFTLSVPDAIAQRLRLTSQQWSRRALEGLALQGYKAGELSRGQVSEMLGLEFNETEKFLKDNGAMLGLSTAEYDLSGAALEELLNR